MEHHEPTADQIADMANAIDVGNTSDALADVQRTVVGRRRRRRAATGVLVSAMLITGGVVAVNNFDGGDDGDDALSIGAAESTDDTDTTGTSDPVTTDGATSPDAALVETPVVEAVPAGAVEIIDATATSVQVTGAVDPFETGWVDWLVPWRDGFLVGKTSQTPQALPDSLPEEVVALFPQEVVDFFDGQLPPTINEAIDMLTDAGLLDEVTAVINENPDAFDAIYSEPVSDPTFDVYFSTDGSEWEQVPFTSPEGSTFLASVQTVGDRLVTLSQRRPDGPTAGPLVNRDSAAPILVSSTTDLVNWDVVEVPVAPRPVDLPELLNYSVHLQTLAVSPDGWVVAAASTSELNIEQILPPDVGERVTMGEFGYSSSTNATGVTVTLDGPFVPEFDADGAPTALPIEPGEEFVFTWDELGIADEMKQWREQGPSMQIWTGSWGGTPVQGGDIATSSIVGSTDGFYASTNKLHYSPDGVTWTTLDVPGDEAVVVEILPIDGGVVAFVSRLDSVDVYLVTGADGEWEMLDLPALPRWLNSNYSGPSTPSSATVLDASPGSFPRPVTVMIEADGYVLTLSNAYPTNSATLVDSDGVTVLEASWGWETSGQVEVIRWTADAVEIVEPDSGDVLLTIDPEVFQDAYSAQNDQVSLDADDYRQDMWLIATTDGRRWLIDDLVDGENGESYFGPNSLAVNGDTLLINLGEEWVTYDLS